MYYSTHPAYIQARAIRTGGRKLAAVHQEVIDWIRSQFKVQALDFYYEQNPRTPTYRILNITIALEAWAECARMETPQTLQQIANRFRIHLRNFNAATESDPLKQEAWPSEEPPIPELSIRFRPLEDVEWTLAWTKAVDELKLESTLKQQFDFVWGLDAGGFNTSQIIFFYRNDQVTEANCDAVMNYLLSILKKYDEFNLFGLQGFDRTSRFDTKEVFDTQYGGSAFNYYR